VTCPDGRQIDYDYASGVAAGMAAIHAVSSTIGRPGCRVIISSGDQRIGRSE
jgi:hypothetical protein